MEESKDIIQYGCTVYSLNGFPYDGDTPYSKEQLAKVRKQLEGLAGRCYVLSLNSVQKAAKKLLEEFGFKVLARTYTSHITTYEDAINEWKKSGMDNQNTIYLMGKGFFKKPAKKRET